MKSLLFPEVDKKTYVMGIINLTSDSFSGDGLYNKSNPTEAALIQARQFIADGADVLDLGAESTRPGSQPVSSETEIDRLLPAIAAIKAALPEALISIDTYKAATADACLKAGAQIINDVWGFQSDPNMAATVAAFGATGILMHNRAFRDKVEKTDLGGRFVDLPEEDIVNVVKTWLEKSIDLARSAGLSDEHIILDPGIGFGKTTSQSLHLLKHLNEISNLGYPLMLGVSRKSFIGYTLKVQAEERLEGSLAANAYGVLNGANILRVHDVRATVRLARMLDAIRAA